LGLAAVVAFLHPSAIAQPLFGRGRPALEDNPERPLTQRQQQWQYCQNLSA
jgi:hypothetical protein